MSLSTKVGALESGRCYADRSQRTRVARPGDLPYINNPTRKIFALNHMATSTEPTETSSESAACHQGGGAVEVRRSSIENPLIGGTKLIAVLNGEFGSSEMRADKT